MTPIAVDLEPDNKQPGDPEKRSPLLKPAVVATVLFALITVWSRPKSGGIVLARLFGAGVIVTQDRPPRNVEAEKFILRDSDKRVRAALGMTSSGPSFTFYDESGKRRAALGMGSTGPALGLFDAEGKPRSWLFASTELAGLVVNAGEANRRGEPPVRKAGCLFMRTTHNGRQTARRQIGAVGLTLRTGRSDGAK